MDDGGVKPSEIVGVRNVHRYALEHTRMSLDAGILGRLFGSAANAPTNVAGVVVVVLSLATVVTLLRSSLSPTEALQLLVPMITLVLGYLFGKQS